MAPVSFASDIKPLFRPMDITHMDAYGVMLADYSYMADPANNYQNAAIVEQTLSPHGDDPPEMPPGGPYWSADQLALFRKWREDGYLP